MHKDIRKYINGTSRAKLNKSDLLTIKINTPGSGEQTKIANFLSLLDLKIEKEQLKQEQLSNLKKGLLQQMFI